MIVIGWMEMRTVSLKETREYTPLMMERESFGEKIHKGHPPIWKRWILIENVQVAKQSQFPKEGQLVEYGSVVKLVFAMYQLGMLKVSSKEQEGAGGVLKETQSTDYVAPRENSQLEDRRESQEQCYPTMVHMVSEPSPRTPIHCVAIKGLKKKSLHVKVLVKGRRPEALVDTRAIASFIQLGVLKKLGLEDKIENWEGSIHFGNGEVERMAGKIRMPLEV